VTERPTHAPDVTPPANVEDSAPAGERARVTSAYARLARHGWYSWSEPAYRFMMHALERRVLRLLMSRSLLPLRGTEVLEVGCGTGYWLRELVKWGADPERVTGVDLMPERLRAARQRCPASVRVIGAGADALPLPAGRFDLVIQAMLFSSILDPDRRRRAAAELLRVVRPGGYILWYDFFVRRPGNRDVVPISRREISALFAGQQVTLRRATLAPPIMRLLAPHAELSCWMLERIPLLRTHFLGLVGPVLERTSGVTREIS
jgi:ubiquinone/menaquinone biosynthesis C-methylase UbiE